MTIACAITVSGQTAAKPADLLPLLPDGGGLLILDGQRVAASPIGTSPAAQKKLNGLIEQLLSSLPNLGLKIEEVNAAAGVVPVGVLKNPTIALSGKFSRTGLLESWKADAKVKVAAEKYKDIDVYNVTRVSDTGTKTLDVSLLFYDEHTIVLGTAAAVRSSVDAKTGSTPSVAKNAKLIGLVGQNPNAALSFALQVTPEMAKSLAAGDLPIPDLSSVSIVFGTVDVNAGINLNATLRSDTPAHAKGLATRLIGVLGLARSFLASDPKNAAIVEALKSMSITTLESDVKIVGSIPFAVLSQDLK
jgi:hypothetical protein